MQYGDFPGPAVMDTLVDDLTNPGTWDPGSGARDALIASGRLELIDNLEASQSTFGMAEPRRRGVG